MVRAGVRGVVIPDPPGAIRLALLAAGLSGCAAPASDLDASDLEMEIDVDPADDPAAMTVRVGLRAGGLPRGLGEDRLRARVEGGDWVMFPAEAPFRLDLPRADRVEVALARADGEEIGGSWAPGPAEFDVYLQDPGSPCYIMGRSPVFVARLEGVPGPDDRFLADASGACVEVEPHGLPPTEDWWFGWQWHPAWIRPLDPRNPEACAVTFSFRWDRIGAIDPRLGGGEARASGVGIQGLYCDLEPPDPR